ncbi:MAG: efflux RND transporter permease subunit [Thermodesulfobacteriota bacterium]|nr:efflux RND transporter permease subunit [Thermodesulfobacteriota bacterium]
MDPVKFSINDPVKIIVGVLVILLFGIIGFLKMPYQLSPDLTVPQITVRTVWTGATPYEIEREIIEEQEKVLKGIPGLIEMESRSSNNRGSVTLKFSIGTDLDDALLRVSNKLNEVRSYPQNVERPVINATGAATSPVIWMMLKTVKGNPNSIYTYRSYFENEIKQYLERVDGVADLFIGGGTEKQMHIILKPEKLAAYGLTIGDIVGVLNAENVNISAGNLNVGRRDFRVRQIGEFKSVKDIENTVIRSTGQRRIFLSDLATVRFGYEKRTSEIIHNGTNGIGMGIKPESGANILELTDKVEKIVKWLNSEKLKEKKIYLHWSHDQRPYIRGAIKLVQTNIMIGGVLAIIVLLIFLRSFSSTVIIATSIPVSIIGSFIFLSSFGRTLNVVSLAGIAFAVGMLMDSAIVVLENIDRHRKMGKPPFQSAYDGTKEVWGAILASSLTTVAVFLPIVFVEEEAGQLFRDIAIAVTCSIMISLFVSVSVIPMFANRLFRLRKNHNKFNGNGLTSIGFIMVDKIIGMVEFAIKNWKTRILTITTLTILSVSLAIFLTPKMEYLPQGNRNFLFSLMIPPPGISYSEKKEIGEAIFRSADPYMGKDYNGLPGVKELFYVGTDRFMFLGSMSMHEQRAGELVPVFSRIINDIPGVFGVTSQRGIFQTRLGGGRTIDVDISANNIDKIIQVAGSMFRKIISEIPNAQIRPVPTLEVLYPEVRIIPERDRLRAVGMSSRDLGVQLDVLLDGRKVGDFKQEGEKKIDLILKASDKEFLTPEKLYRAVVATPKGRIVPISSLSQLQRTTGVSEIRHLERQRTITLQVTPPKKISLEASMHKIRDEIIPFFKGQGMLKGVNITLSGEADKLTQTRNSLQWNFILAAIIIYLLMSGLFGNFIYPLVVLFTLPLAAAGGFIGLKLVNLFIQPQSLDVLTMLGFVILIGVVVNNAILIVYQALNNVRLHGMNYREAVIESTRTRLRPIYMSTFTSIFGMLPLVMAPGPGSEIYRGLGSVILGGLALSSIFVIFIIPSLLMFFIKMEKAGQVS